MVEPDLWSIEDLVGAFAATGVNHYYGVPDSALAGLGSLLETRPDCQHHIAVDEGQAVAWAIGYHLATGRLPLVYLQNSGLGHAMNPLVSLADPLVWGIPMIVLVGWRGRPGQPDEPQHQRQGRITESVLRLMGCQPRLLAPNLDEMQRQVAQAAAGARGQERPVALLLAPGHCWPGPVETPLATTLPNREQAIEQIIASLPRRAALVATTGRASRELFELRRRAGDSHDQDLLVVGGMGHAASVGAAIARQQADRPIYCLDGDGAALMHLGCLATTGVQAPTNFFHFVLNNGAHESVGGQPTVRWDVDFCAIALACGYRGGYRCLRATDLSEILQRLPQMAGPVLIDVRLAGGSRPDLSRPDLTPTANKQSMMRFLRSGRRDD